uniref:Uncharacterized protein n=1 Tax=Arundo donax TaxID=35708 RepID=A0A0A9GD90_ARUDO
MLGPTRGPAPSATSTTGRRCSIRCRSPTAPRELQEARPSTATPGLQPRLQRSLQLSATTTPPLGVNSLPYHMRPPPPGVLDIKISSSPVVFDNIDFMRLFQPPLDEANKALPSGRLHRRPSSPAFSWSAEPSWSRRQIHRHDVLCFPVRVLLTVL